MHTPQTFLDKVCIGEGLLTCFIDGFAFETRNDLCIPGCVLKKKKNNASINNMTPDFFSAKLRS